MVNFFLILKAYVFIFPEKRFLSEGVNSFHRLNESNRKDKIMLRRFMDSERLSELADKLIGLVITVALGAVIIINIYSLIVLISLS
jgi:hypothetical protein